MRKGVVLPWAISTSPTHFSRVSGWSYRYCYRSRRGPLERCFVGGKYQTLTVPRRVVVGGGFDWKSRPLLPCMAMTSHFWARRSADCLGGGGQRLFEEYKNTRLTQKVIVRVVRVQSATTLLPRPICNTATKYIIGIRSVLTREGHGGETQRCKPVLVANAVHANSTHMSRGSAPQHIFA